MGWGSKPGVPAATYAENNAWDDGLAMLPDSAETKSINDRLMGAVPSEAGLIAKKQGRANVDIRQSIGSMARKPQRPGQELSVGRVGLAANDLASGQMQGRMQGTAGARDAYGLAFSAIDKGANVSFAGLRAGGKSIAANQIMADREGYNAKQINKGMMWNALGSGVAGAMKGSQRQIQMEEYAQMSKQMKELQTELDAIKARYK